MNAVNIQHGNYPKKAISAADFALSVKTIILLFFIFFSCFIIVELAYFFQYHHQYDLFYFISSSLVFFICSMCVYFLYFKGEASLKLDKPFVILTVLLVAFQMINIPEVEPGTSLRNLMTSSNVSYFLIMIFFGPVYEEVLFRGCLFGSLCTLTNRIGGGLIIPVLVTSIIFSLYHTQYTTISAYSFEFMVSIILSIIRIHTKGLLGPIVSHGVLNLFAVLGLICTVI